MEKEGKTNSNFIISSISTLFFFLVSFISTSGTKKNGYNDCASTFKVETNFDNLLNSKVEEIKQHAEAEMSLFKFELALASIPKKEKIKATKSVQKYRKEKWKKALKLAKDNEEKAQTIYDEI